MSKWRMRWGYKQAHREGKKFLQNLVGKLNERVQLGGQDVDGRILK
jgi:hypothetical protein